MRKNTLVRLGKHKIVYGDATEMVAYENLFKENEKIDLLLTDPPYNVNYQGSKKKRKKLLNDSLKERYPKFVFEFLSNAKHYMLPGAAYYIFTASSEIGTYQNTLKELDMYQSMQLVWVKNHFVLSFADYKAKHEHIMYGWKKGVAHKFYGAKNENTVLSYPKPTKNVYHPTQKPDECIKRLILNSSIEGDIVFDPFLGSGTTLLQAQANNRRCYGIELDVEYINIIISRFKHFYPEEKIIFEEM